MSMIWIAHVKIYNPVSLTEETLYFSSSSYTSGATGYPTGGAAHTYYDPRIKQPAVMQRNIFSSGTTFGASQVGYGALELINLDGELDYLVDYGLDGRVVTLILGEMAEGDVAPTWSIVLTGTMEEPEISWDKITLRIRDRLVLLDKPLSLNTYAGSNVLPAGLEGVEDDLKGKRKPKLFGQVFNISPPVVNTSLLIYQVNDGAINTIDAVYDRGAALTQGTDYISEVDMTTNNPAAGYYRVWPAGGYFRLGSNPDGTITCDATQGATSADRTVAQILKTIAVDQTDLVAGDVDTGDVTDLDTLNSSVVGIWVSGDETTKTVMDEISNSIGAWYGFDRLGKLRMGQLSVPSGTATATISAADIITIDRIVSNDPGRGIAAWKVALNYKKCYTVQTTDLAGVVTDARKAELSKEFRSIEKTDITIQTKHILAPDMKFDTLLVSASDADTEADRRLTLYKGERSMYELRVALDSSVAATLELSDVVTVTLPRYGMSAGKDFRVIGIKPNFQLRLVDLTIWG